MSLTYLSCAEVRSCCLQDFTTKFWSQDLFFDEQKVLCIPPA